MIGDEKIPSKNTTPESYELHRMFASMVEAGCEYAVMEVSSQGLKMDVQRESCLIMVCLPTFPGSYRTK